MAAADEYTIYVLRLREDKFYVGKTTGDVQDCFIEHAEGTSGVEWTHMYPPVKILHKTKPDQPASEEDAEVLRCMDEFGIESVRGGSYDRIELSEQEIADICTKMALLHNVCVQCHKAGHFAAQCSKRQRSSVPAAADPLRPVAATEQKTKPKKGKEVIPKSEFDADEFWADTIAAYEPLEVRSDNPFFASKHGYVGGGRGRVAFHPYKSRGNAISLLGNGVRGRGRAKKRQ